MALSSSTYYSNSIVGQMMAGVDVNVFDTHSAPKYPVGQGFTRADGNVFRYCHVGTATSAGQLIGPTTASGGKAYSVAQFVAPASAVVVPAEYPILPGQAGSHYIELTVSSIAANKYQGGYLITSRGTGLGETYRIIGNTATDNPATGNLRIQLAEALKVSLVVNTGLLIVPSMFTDCAASATSSTQVTGVLMATTTSTNLWAWVCTRGVVGCLEDSTNTVVAGQNVMASRVTAGAYASATVSTGTLLVAGAFSSPIVGYSITPSGTGRQTAIYLQLE